MREKQEGVFSCRAWGRAQLSQTKCVAFLEASIRILPVRVIHWQVQGVALKEAKSLWSGDWFQAPIWLMGCSAG